MVADIGEDGVAMPPQVALPDAAARRLAHQLERAYHGTFGAKTGLRMIVTSIAKQLQTAGLSPAAIEVLLVRQALEHPARHAGDPPHLLTGEPHAQVLAQLVRECVTAAVRASSSSGSAPD